MLQVCLSQVFVGMRQAQQEHLFSVLDWGIANAKLEEVNTAYFLQSWHTLIPSPLAYTAGDSCLCSTSDCCRFRSMP